MVSFGRKILHNCFFFCTLLRICFKTNANMFERETIMSNRGNKQDISIGRIYNAFFQKWYYYGVSRWLTRLVALVSNVHLAS